ncbi:hypothetical protein TNCV_4072001 [Trichonephila clavipes]|uniref:Uncharacterized protein n=1 Tax=Trichonephila clavipes TaxID=2585209 RepID=A0A8X6W7R9_TRICX|nr:hypothetical protein TNCV_4072001 [Trichonephila clavipes]
MNMKRKENVQMLPKELHQLKYETISVPQGSVRLKKGHKKEKVQLAICSSPKCHEFEPSTTKDTSCMERCTLNLSRAQTSSCWSGVVVKRGQLKYRPRQQ